MVEVILSLTLSEDSVRLPLAEEAEENNRYLYLQWKYSDLTSNVTEINSAAALTSFVLSNRSVTC